LRQYADVAILAVGGEGETKIRNRGCRKNRGETQPNSKGTRKKEPDITTADETGAGGVKTSLGDNSVDSKKKRARDRPIWERGGNQIEVRRKEKEGNYVENSPVSKDRAVLQKEP